MTGFPDDFIQKIVLEQVARFEADIKKYTKERNWPKVEKTFFFLGAFLSADDKRRPGVCAYGLEELHETLLKGEVLTQWGGKRPLTQPERMWLKDRLFNCHYGGNCKWKPKD